MQDAHDLSVLINSRIPLLVIETHDENGAMQLLQRVARDQQRTLYRWSVTDGLDTAGFGLRLEKAPEFCEPEVLLGHLKTRGQPGIYMLCDFHPWLSDQPKRIRLLKDIALSNEHGAMTLVFVSHALTLPTELSRHSARFSISLPGDGEIMALVKEEARKWSVGNQGARVKADPQALERLAQNLKGLSHAEVKRLARVAIVDDGAITEADIPEINLAKFRLMDMEGVLSYEYNTEQFAAVGGMDNLKQWLEVRRLGFGGRAEASEPTAASAPGLEPAKGVLLLGVQGAGKSLAARAVAGLWGLPLLRLDMGAVYNKYHGETERNLRDSLALADQMSPCVLWIDEIEKGLGADDSDGGLTRRVLGTLLTWMAERKSRVFLVATANDISRLAPELVRKGRFDEIFFVELPDVAVRAQIIGIHLRKRELDPAQFDIEQLATACEGFSGAEIEQAVVASLYGARAASEPLATRHIAEEISRTSPLSRVMAEKLAELRSWAAERNLLLA
ncbi:MAG: ATPase [Gammaproteobacteria bacterium BRH_c0]|nr:MAG: ATPase [Gammaproteobacteria bacterium BRH_c0]